MIEDSLRGQSHNTSIYVKKLYKKTTAIKNNERKIYYAKNCYNHTFGNFFYLYFYLFTCFLFYFIEFGEDFFPTIYIKFWWNEERKKSQEDFGF